MAACGLWGTKSRRCEENRKKVRENVGACAFLNGADGKLAPIHRAPAMLYAARISEPDPVTARFLLRQNTR